MGVLETILLKLDALQADVAILKESASVRTPVSEGGAVTVSRAAMILGYGSAKVRQLIHDGVLASIGTGRGVRVTMESIHRFTAPEKQR